MTPWRARKEGFVSRTRTSFFLRSGFHQHGDALKCSRVAARRTKQMASFSRSHFTESLRGANRREEGKWPWRADVLSAATHDCQIKLISTVLQLWTLHNPQVRTRLNSSCEQSDGDTTEKENPSRAPHWSLGHAKNESTVCWRAMKRPRQSREDR